MAFNGTGLLEGQSPPLATITPTDQTGIILIATALGLAFVFISLLIRVYLHLEIRHSISSDDVAVIVAFAIGIAQVAAVFTAASKGYGKTIADIPQENLVPIQKALYSGDILYVITIWLTKCSVAFLTLRLSSSKDHNGISKAILVISTIFMVISVFIIALKCDLSHPWLFLGGECGNVMPRWQTIAAFDVITEVALFATSVYLIAGLQLSLHKKSIVIFAFALRLPIIALIFLRLHFLPQEVSSMDPTLQGITSSVFTQLEISYAIFAATTPCLRPFMTALNTHYGAPAHTRTPKGTKGSGNTYSLELSDFSKGSRTGREKGKGISGGCGGGGGLVTRWDRTENRTEVRVGDNQSLESHSSKRMIISKDVDWTIDYEGQAGVGSAK